MHDLSKRTKQYSAHYEWDGALWTIDFSAYDMEDAQARCATFGAVKFAGEIVMVIPCTPVSAPVFGLLVRLGCWMGNLLRRTAS